MEFYISIEDKEVRSLIDKISETPKVVSTWLGESVAPYMRESFKKNFEAEGRPDSWAPLKNSTAEIRALGNEMGWWNTGPYHPILQRTGELMKLVTNTQEKIMQAGDDIVMEMDPRENMGKFSGSKHGGAHSYEQHQLGELGSTITGETGMKQRPMVLFQEEDLVWVTSRFQDLLETMVNK